MSIRMAQRYEAAWHKLYYELPKWKQQEVVADPFGRVSSELAHEVARLAEAEGKIAAPNTGQK